LVLLLLCIIPGVIYYVWVESIPFCSGCGRRVSAKSSAQRVT
jgi:hypothetical protein